MNVGEISLTSNRLDIAANDGLTIFTYTAEPGSRSEDALKRLGSWSATQAIRTTTSDQVTGEVGVAL